MNYSGVLISAIVDSDVDDVRPVLQYYSNFDNPLAEYRENQKKLLKMEESKSKAMHHYDDSLTKNWSGWCLGEMMDELCEYGIEFYITKFVRGGPKNYAYKLYGPSTDQYH
uniref:Uncharacterized protein n=1 Tax=Romanomermis culicivorax TaxID=13658 RepID=A0A915KI22_ROMCU